MECPVCREKCKETEKFHYCENCGFNHDKTEEHPEPLANNEAKQGNS